MQNAQQGINDLKVQNTRIQDMSKDLQGLIAKEKDFQKVTQESKLQALLKAKLIEDDIASRVLNQQKV